MAQANQDYLNARTRADWDNDGWGMAPVDEWGPSATAVAAAYEVVSSILGQAEEPDDEPEERPPPAPRSPRSIQVTPHDKERKLMNMLREGEELTRNLPRPQPRSREYHRDRRRHHHDRRGPSRRHREPPAAPAAPALVRVTTKLMQLLGSQHWIISDSNKALGTSSDDNLLKYKEALVLNPGFRLEEARMLYPDETWPEPLGTGEVSDADLVTMMTTAIESGKHRPLQYVKITPDQLEWISSGDTAPLQYGNAEMWRTLTRNLNFDIAFIMKTMYHADFPFNWDYYELCRRPDITVAQALDLTHDIMRGEYQKMLEQQYGVSIDNTIEQMEGILRENPAFGAEAKMFWGDPYLCGRGDPSAFIAELFKLDVDPETGAFWSAPENRLYWLIGLENNPQLDQFDLQQLGAARPIRWADVAENMLEFHPRLKRSKVPARPPLSLPLPTPDHLM